MQLLITFLEGLITFISPCVLPMLPVYVLYFTGGDARPAIRRTLLRALCFVLGFSLVFMLLGVFAGTLGSLLLRYQRMVNLITGGLVTLFGLHYAGILRITLLERTLRPQARIQAKGCASCILLGAAFAVGWSPCTGPFLSAAMMLAASEGQVMTGMLLLLGYALGLGLPFVLCALLIDRLKGALAWVKRHYAVINKLCGVFLICVGVLMMSGLYRRLSSMLPSAPAIELSALSTSAAPPESTHVPTAVPAESRDEVAGPVFKRMAKDFTAYDDDGNAVHLSDYLGKPVVVNFFASWCGPCKLEMPFFQAAFQQYGDRVQFLMVNLCGYGNDRKADAKQMVADGGYTFPLLFDEAGEAAVAYAIRAMPTTVFVSAEGELLDQHIGMLDEATLMKTVADMAAEAKP